jgi:hypothetical protein
MPVGVIVHSRPTVHDSVAVDARKTVLRNIKLALLERAESRAAFRTRKDNVECAVSHRPKYATNLGAREGLQDREMKNPPGDVTGGF